MMKKRVAVILGAAKTGIDRSLLNDYAVLDGPERALIYCADGGLIPAAELGLKPDFLIGDFDSLARTNPVQGLGSANAGMTGKIISLPAEKDETDLFACALDGLKSGITVFILIYCTGGRLDHFMGALAVLEYLADQGARGIVLDRQNEITLMGPGSRAIDKDSRYPYLSLIPLDERLTGVSLVGFKYPLVHAEILRKNGLCISNEVIEDKAHITLDGGRALLIRSKDGD
jgi:thiamine pyrophosphokinase